MKVFLRILIALSWLLLQGCGGGSSAESLDSSVRIGYISKQNIIPAVWEFSFENDEALQSFQWQFSDDTFSSRVSGQQRQVVHTFTESGVHKVRLLYTTVDGKEGVVESDVIVKAGSVSGDLFAALNTLVDVDTRDTKEPSDENNSFATAQPLTASSRIAGVVDSNDPIDVYQVQLQKDQSINVQVADQINQTFAAIRVQVFTSDHIDTAIFEATTQPDAGHLSLPFIAPSTDRYFIKLTAISPQAFNTSAGIQNSHGIYSLHVDVAADYSHFVAGELVVMMKNQREYQAQGISSKMDLGRIKGLSLTSARQFMATKNIAFSRELDDNSHWQTLQVAKLLATQEDVLYAEPNWRRYPSAATEPSFNTLSNVSDPLFSSQWHYAAINLESAWESMNSRGSDAVIVAILDTGVLINHPDLSANLIAGYDFIDDDTDANDPGDKSINGQQSSFHGTHVAGTVAAIEGSAINGGIGGTGVAPGVKIMPVRVLGSEGGTSLQVIAGLCFAAQLNSSDHSLCRNVPVGSTADVINLSLGGANFSNTEQAVYNAVMDKDIIVIAAAGNKATSVPYYPAAYDNVISVSATNRKTELASYSNFGDRIDVAAPGGDFSVDDGVLSTLGDDSNGSARLTYGYLQGTSMAAPHVAGVAALMKSIKPELTHNEFRGLLTAGDLTQDIGSTGQDYLYGFGLIDAHKSVLKLIENARPQILSSVGDVFFDVSQIQRQFTLSARGVDETALGTINVTIAGSENGDDSSWLTLDRTQGLGQYTLTAVRGDRVEGRYNARIVISSDRADIDDVVINVVLQVGNAALSANAGVQYVVLFSANAVANELGKLEGVAGDNGLRVSNGKYSYRIEDLEKGDYTILAGSDLDFDGSICDGGESCGQYPTLSQKGILTISEDNPNLNIDLTVNYLTTSIGTSAFHLFDELAPQPVEKFSHETSSEYKTTLQAPDP